MKHVYHSILIFILAGLVGQLTAQPIEAQRELEKARRAIERTEAVLRLLPGDLSSDIRNTLESRLRDARIALQEAIQFVENGQFHRAKLVIAQIYSTLKQIEQLIRNHPVFKIKFKEQLDRKIHQAEELVGDGRNDEALYMLNRAKFYRRRAYSISAQSDRPYAALEYYRLALHFADQAIRTGSGNRTDLSVESLRSLYFETEMLMKRIETLLEGKDAPQQIGRMVERAEDELRSARSLYERGETRLAQQKLVTVNRILYRIMDLIERRPEHEADRVQFDLEGLQFSLNTLTSQIDAKKTPAAYRLAGRARQLLEDIRVHLNRKQPALAKKKLRIANQLILRLSRLVEKTAKTDPEMIAENLNALRMELEEYNAIDQTDPGYQPLYDLVKENLAEADQNLSQGNYLAASRRLRMARQLLYQLNRLANRGKASSLRKDVAEADLEQLRILLQRLENSSKTDEAFAVKYKNARNLYKLAEQALNQNRFKVSSEYSKLGVNFLTK